MPKRKPLKKRTDLTRFGLINRPTTLAAKETLPKKKLPLQTTSLELFGIKIGEMSVAKKETQPTAKKTKQISLFGAQEEIPRAPKQQSTEAKPIAKPVPGKIMTLTEKDTQLMNEKQKRWASEEKTRKENLKKAEEEYKKGYEVQKNEEIKQVLLKAELLKSIGGYEIIKEYGLSIEKLREMKLRELQALREKLENEFDSFERVKSKSEYGDEKDSMWG